MSQENASHNAITILIKAIEEIRDSEQTFTT